MSLLNITKIDSKAAKELIKCLDEIHTKIATKDKFGQPIIDEICNTVAACRTALNDAIAEVAAEKKRLAKDVFADRLIHDVFETIRGDEAAFPQRVYDNHEAISASYRAGLRNLDAFEQNLCKEWEDISRMSNLKRKNFVLLARRKLMMTIAELEKARERGVEESKRLEDEIRNLQSTLKMTEELEEAKQEEC